MFILSAMVGDAQPLMKLMRGIVAGDAAAVAQSLAASPALASSSLRLPGATRLSPQDYFFDEIAHYLFAGDTPLHAAAAAHRKTIVPELVSMGADVRARNRRGAQPLHYAVDGIPGSAHWDPNAQRDTVVALLEAGADPNAVDKGGVMPLHRAAIGAPRRFALSLRGAPTWVAQTGRAPRRFSSPTGQRAAMEVDRPSPRRSRR